jgi:hypothetical protein
MHVDTLAQLHTAVVWGRTTELTNAIFFIPDSATKVRDQEEDLHHISRYRGCLAYHKKAIR